MVLRLGVYCWAVASKSCLFRVALSWGSAAKRMFEKSWQIKTHGTRTTVRPSCLEAGMGNKVGEI